MCTIHSGLASGGRDCKNMWIVKPAAKSRGRGIMCFNDLPKLLKYVSADTGTSTLWIVQKYMENALIVSPYIPSCTTLSELFSLNNLFLIRLRRENSICVSGY